MITKQVYSELDDALNFFNKRLFGGHLPDVMVVMSNKNPRSRAHFAPNRFVKRGGTDMIHELNLNPDAYIDRTDIQILSSLVHEQAHLQQQETGKPSRGGYHNKQWASMMEAVGLMPSDTEQEGGRKTGQSMTHYIIEGGAFDIASKQFLKSRKGFQWESVVYNKVAGQSKKTRWKFTCPNCAQNAWAKEIANLGCGDCSCKMERED